MNLDNLDPDIQPIGFTPEEEAALVAFMKALTDPRVVNEKKPYDHPELFAPNGHPVDEFTVLTDNGIDAKDDLVRISPVGKMGREKEGLAPLTEVGFHSKLAR